MFRSFRWCVFFFGVILVMMGSGAATAQDVNLTAEVDKSEVKFGESLNLFLTLSQEMQGYSGQRLAAPNVERIPGFDIVGRRTAQSMNFVNGAGHVQVQTVFELIPDGPGEKTIPGFAINLPGGRTVSSRPLTVKVLEPAKEEEAAEEDESESDETRAKGGISFWKGLLIVGLVVGLIVISPVLLSMLLTRGVKPSTRWKGEDRRPTRTVAPDAVGSVPPAQRPVDDPGNEELAEIVPAAPVAEVDFQVEVNALTRLHPETDLDFYRAYFDVYHRALIAGSSRLQANQTPDELSRQLQSLLPVDRHEALKRMAGDWESVVFARTRPARSFHHIQDDALLILNTLRSQETLP